MKNSVVLLWSYFVNSNAPLTILLHFSAGTRVVYDSAREFHNELARWVEHC